MAEIRMEAPSTKPFSFPMMRFAVATMVMQAFL
jgi:hypothetical protein